MVEQTLEQKLEATLKRFAPEGLRQVYERPLWWIKPPEWTDEDEQKYHELLVGLRKKCGLRYEKLNVREEIKKSHSNARKLLWGFQATLAAISIPILALDNTDFWTGLLALDTVAFGGMLYSFGESWTRYKPMGEQYWNIKRDLREGKQGITGKYLEGEQAGKAKKHFELARQEALKSTCKSTRGGAVIISPDGKLIGKGHNGPPLDACIVECIKNNLPANFKSDRACCVHAEQRAILDAARNHPEKLGDSTIYFTWVDGKGSIKPAGNPYCTVCSKLSVDAGLKDFVLWHEEGICAYNTKDYNALSFQHKAAQTI